MCVCVTYLARGQLEFPVSELWKIGISICTLLPFQLTFKSKSCELFQTEGVESDAYCALHLSQSILSKREVEDNQFEEELVPANMRG